MSERERLVELLKQNCHCKDKDCSNCNSNGICFTHREADYLLENCVIVPPVKVGDTVYVIPKYNGNPYCGVQQDKVQMIGKTSRGIHIKTRNKSSFNKTYMFGKTAFLTKEQAEKALKGADK